MPHSIARFLRMYASIVVLLVTSVLALGVAPARTGVDFSNVTTEPATFRDIGAAQPVIPRPLLALETFVSNVHVSTPAVAVRSLAWTQPSPIRDASAAKLCGQALLRVRRES